MRDDPAAGISPAAEDDAHRVVAEVAAVRRAIIPLLVLDPEYFFQAPLC